MKKMTLVATLIAGLTSTAALAGWWYTASANGSSPSSWPAACSNAVSTLQARYPNITNVTTRIDGYDTYNLRYHCIARGQYQK